MITPFTLESATIDNTDAPLPEMSIQEKLQVAVDRINAAVAEYKPIAVFGLFSGGNDSLPATYATTLANGFTAAVHVNTGIGVKATREFVRRTCEERGWPLLEYKAMENMRADGTPDPMDYRAMCLANGFPGPFAHRFMYVKLKERQLARLERDMGATPKRQVLYVTGARSAESQRRMGNVEPFRMDGRRLWMNAIHDWTSTDCAALRMHVGLKQNVVCERIGMSGECLCGAFAKPGELEILRGWPETHEAWLEITGLQCEVRAAGFPWNWGEEAPDWWKEKQAGQMSLLEPDEATGMELCHNCTKHHGGRD